MSKFNHLPLKTKLIVFYTIILVSSFCLAFTVCFNFYKTNTLAKDAYLQLTKRNERTDKVRKIALKLDELVYYATKNGNLSYEEVNVLNLSLNDLKRAVYALETNRYKEDVFRIRHLTDSYISLVRNKLIFAIKANDELAIKKIYTDDLLPYTDELIDISSHFTKIHYQKAQDRINDILNPITFVPSIVLCIFLLLINTLSGLYLINYLRKDKAKI